MHWPVHLQQQLTKLTNKKNFGIYLLKFFQTILRNYSFLQATLGLGGTGRQVFYPCALCNETFRWQFDLYKHYATQHFYDELASQLQLEGGPPYKCHLCSTTTDTEKQMVIHFGLAHKAVQKILQKTVGGTGGDRYEPRLDIVLIMLTLVIFSSGYPGYGTV